MTTTPIRLTLEEYLAYDDGTDKRYELVAGELVEMPPESPQNAEIAIYLLLAFARFVSPRLLRCKDTEIVVSGIRATTRLPDLMVLTEELVRALFNTRRGTITPDMPPPALVVEVVSPGKVNEDRDYRYKRSEYAARGISEYWIVNPQINRVSVLILVEGLYEETIFEGSTVIVSSIFPELQLTAQQILTAGRLD